MRFFSDVPMEVENNMIRSARTLLGDGYIDDYYASAASEFGWLYSSGYRAGLAYARKRAKAIRRRKTGASVIDGGKR